MPVSADRGMAEQDLIAAQNSGDAAAALAALSEMTRNPIYSSQNIQDTNNKLGNPSSNPPNDPNAGSGYGGYYGGGSGVASSYLVGNGKTQWDELMAQLDEKRQELAQQLAIENQQEQLKRDLQTQQENAANQLEKVKDASSQLIAGQTNLTDFDKMLAGLKGPTDPYSYLFMSRGLLPPEGYRAANMPLPQSVLDYYQKTGTNLADLQNWLSGNGAINAATGQAGPVTNQAINPNDWVQSGSGWQPKSGTDFTSNGFNYHWIGSPSAAAAMSAGGTPLYFASSPGVFQQAGQQFDARGNLIGGAGAPGWGNTALYSATPVDTTQPGPQGAAQYAPQFAQGGPQGMNPSAPTFMGMLGGMPASFGGNQGLAAFNPGNFGGPMPAQPMSGFGMPGLGGPQPAQQFAPQMAQQFNPGAPLPNPQQGGGERGVNPSQLTPFTPGTINASSYNNLGAPTTFNLSQAQPVGAASPSGSSSPASWSGLPSNITQGNLNFNNTGIVPPPVGVGGQMGRASGLGEGGGLASMGAPINNEFLTPSGPSNQINLGLNDIFGGNSLGMAGNIGMGGNVGMGGGIIDTTYNPKVLGGGQPIGNWQTPPMDLSKLDPYTRALVNQGGQPLPPSAQQLAQMPQSALDAYKNYIDKVAGGNSQDVLDMGAKQTGVQSGGAPMSGVFK